MCIVCSKQRSSECHLHSCASHTSSRCCCGSILVFLSITHFTVGKNICNYSLWIYQISPNEEQFYYSFPAYFLCCVAVHAGMHVVPMCVGRSRGNSGRPPPVFSNIHLGSCLWDKAAYWNGMVAISARLAGCSYLCLLVLELEGTMPSDYVVTRSELSSSLLCNKCSYLWNHLTRSTYNFLCQRNG